MRDAIKIFAAGSMLTAYALLAPTMVEAVPAAAPTQKVLTQRLSQAGGDAPVSAVTEAVGHRKMAVVRSAVPSIALLGEVR